MHFVPPSCREDQVSPVVQLTCYYAKSYWDGPLEDPFQEVQINYLLACFYTNGTNLSSFPRFHGIIHLLL